MTRQRILATVVTAAATAMAVLPGCAQQDPVMAPPAGRQDPLVGQDYPNIVAMDNLSYWLVFDPDVRPGTPQRPMEVITGVRLARDAPLAIQYAYQFFDAQGTPLNTPDQWQWMHLDPRVQYHLRGNAMETSAVDWRLQVRSAR